MGIIISLVVLTTICITIVVVSVKCWGYSLEDCDAVPLCAWIWSILAVFATIGVSIACCVIQAQAPTENYRLEQHRESLVESYNEYKNEYDDDVAHAQTLKEIRKEIASFNSEINKNNHFCDNFFLNWFYIDCTSIEPITIKDGVAQ